jgi:hypothetical protein
MTIEYETLEGTQPVAHGVHEPRTVARLDDKTDLYMMSEIGDGVFVQWGNCRRCSVRVGNCKCPEGPKEPEYIKGWRDERFAKDLNTRPEPSYDLLPSLVEWLEERGYEVTKSVKKQLEEAKPYDPNDPDFAPIDLTDEESEAFDKALAEGEPDSGEVPESAGITAKSAEEAREIARKSSAFDDRPPGNIYEIPEDF